MNALKGKESKKDDPIKTQRGERKRIPKEQPKHAR